MIPPELRARFTDAAKRAADEGEREAPITPGSDTAVTLGRLYSGFPRSLCEAQQAGRDAA